MIKLVLKILLLVVVTTVSFVVVSSLLPWSEAFRAESQRAEDGSSLIYVLISHLWMSVAIWYIVTRSSWSNLKLALGLFFSFFFVYSFMTQIETLFFSSAFPLLTVKDIFLITIGNGVPVLTGVLVAIWLFANDRIKEPQSSGFTFNSQIIYRLMTIGAAYVVIYFLFGYYIAWQSEELRVFYSGSNYDAGFWNQLVNNVVTNPIIFPFQFLRGILFAVFILPLVAMFYNNRKTLLWSILLIYLATAIVLIIPNFLFPDGVRWAHFYEMSTSMALFAVVVGLVMSYRNQPTPA